MALNVKFNRLIAMPAIPAKSRSCALPHLHNKYTKSCFKSFKKGQNNYKTNFSRSKLHLNFD